jgi:hypothetical protein
MFGNGVLIQTMHIEICELHDFVCLASLQVCETLPWWPGWFRDIKHLLRFLRINSYREVLVTAANARGLDGSLLRKKPPSLVNWRWSLMLQVLIYLLPLFVIFDEIWDAEVFKNCKAKSLELAGRTRALCTKFRYRFMIVHDVLFPVNKIRTWASGCSCHEAERLAGHKVSCWFTGKRLPEALDRVNMFLMTCELCAEHPLPDQQCYGIEADWTLEEERKFAFQHCLAITTEETQWLKDQPYSLARVTDVAGLVAERDRWFALPPARRHRVVSHLFLPSHQGG